MSKLSSEIIDIEAEERDELSYHQFVAFTPSGVPFTVQMLGKDHTHAYRRLNNQTEKSVNLPNLIAS